MNSKVKEHIEGQRHAALMKALRTAKKHRLVDADGKPVDLCGIPVYQLDEEPANVPSEN